MKNAVIDNKEFFKDMSQYYLNNKKAQKEFTKFFHAEKYLNNLKRIFKHKKKDAFQRLLFFLLRFRISFLYSAKRKAKQTKADTDNVRTKTNMRSAVQNQSSWKNMVTSPPLQK